MAANWVREADTSLEDQRGSRRAPGKVNDVILGGGKDDIEHKQQALLKSNGMQGQIDIPRSVMNDLAGQRIDQRLDQAQHGGQDLSDSGRLAGGVWRSHVNSPLPSLPLESVGSV